MKAVRPLFLASTLLLASVAAFAVPATHASFTFDVAQVGGDVVITGSGTLDTTCLTNYGESGDGDGAAFVPKVATLINGPLEFFDFDTYTGVSGPSSFGTIPNYMVFDPSTGSGDVVAIAGGSELLLPPGYVSGTYLSDTDTYDNTTLSALDAVPGVYTYAWGSDTLTVDIVPEPSTWALLFAGGAVLSICVLRRRRLQS